MSNSVRPQIQQPTRFPRPWDSPGKNTGVGCHFPLQCMKVKSESEVVQSCPTLHDPMDCSPPGSLRPWDFPGKSTGVGCHCLLRETRAGLWNCAVYHLCTPPTYIMPSQAGAASRFRVVSCLPKDARFPRGSQRHPKPIQY